MAITTSTHVSDLGPFMECHWEEDPYGITHEDAAWIEALADMGNVTLVAPVVTPRFKAPDYQGGYAIRQEFGADVVLMPGDRFIISAGSVARR